MAITDEERLTRKVNGEMHRVAWAHGYSIREMVELCGIPYSTYNRRMHNPMGFQADELRRIMQAMPDCKLLDILMGGDGD